MKASAILPQTQGVKFITDGGLETTAIFKDGIELPVFSSIHLMREERGRDYLKRYYKNFLQLAKDTQFGFILESPTWRASSDWADDIGVAVEELTQLNIEAIDLLVQLKDQYHSKASPVVIAGSVGPRGDGYSILNKMSVAEAKAYHLPQIETLAKAGVDFISALTINYEEEGVGLVLAARDANIPIILSFTVETDGKLPNGNRFENAIVLVDEVTNNYPSYFMINCAHPTHFLNELKNSSQVLHRIKGLRVNASCKSHKELDNSTILDEGDPVELGRQLAEIEAAFPHITVLGGCCGTDYKHIEQICAHRRAFAN